VQLRKAGASLMHVLFGLPAAEQVSVFAACRWQAGASSSEGGAAGSLFVSQSYMAFTDLLASHQVSTHVPAGQLTKCAAATPRQRVGVLGCSWTCNPLLAKQGRLWRPTRCVGHGRHGLGPCQAR
jgi:hypothetical protein